MVIDLEHYLDLPVETPGPARRFAEHLGDIVRAATAGDAGTAWESAVGCARRPTNRACPGRMIVLLTDTAAPIRWHCSTCEDTGIISNWADSPFDLRRRELSVAEPTNDIVISYATAAALRDVLLLDPDCERLVYRIRAHHDGAVLTATDDDLEELIGALAAEANHETNRRRQQRLDVALDELNDTTAGR